jgi:hypothetical protein
MTEVNAAEHTVVLELSEAAPLEVTAGTKFALPVRLACASGCDLSGVPITVTTPDGTTSQAEKLDAAADGGDADVQRIALTAPRTIGEYVWRVSAGGHEIAGVRHEANSLDVAVKAKPHPTSLAVWAIPSPVVTGQRFALKVGAKSAAGCELSGQSIEVLDERGAAIASGRLGPTPWPDTTALFWAELEVTAPDQPGMFGWSVRFAPADLDLPHDGASSRFSIAIAPAPEHRLTVKVVEQTTSAPIPDAWIRLGPYKAATSESGLAEIMMPKGKYDLYVWKAGYEAPEHSVAIDGDTVVEITATVVPEYNTDTAWQM